MSATLKPAIPGGTIRSQDSESDFLDWVLNRTPSRRLLLIEIQPGGIGGDSQVKGKVTTTKYQIVNAAEIRDPHEADQLRHRITQLRADQGFATKEPRLFDMTEAEQVESLKDLIKDHASAHDLPMAQVDARFQELFAGGEHPVAETVQACRSVTLLKELAYDIGALDDLPAGYEPQPQDLDSAEDGAVFTEDPS